MSTPAYSHAEAAVCRSACIPFSRTTGTPAACRHRFDIPSNTDLFTGPPSGVMNTSRTVTGLPSTIRHCSVTATGGKRFMCARRAATLGGSGTSRGFRPLGGANASTRARPSRPGTI